MVQVKILRFGRLFLTLRNENVNRLSKLATFSMYFVLKKKMNTSYVIRKSRYVHPLELGMSNSGLNFVRSSSAGIFATLPLGANTADLEYRHVFMFLYS